MKKTTAKSLKFKLTALSSMLLATGFMAGNVNAQWVVTDPGHMVTTVSGHAATLGKVYKEYQRAEKELNNLKARLGGLKDMGVKMEDKFEPVALTYGMQAKCPGAGGLNLSELMSSVSLTASSNNLSQIRKLQADICKRLVMAENVKYNETVKVLKHMRQQDEKLKEIVKERDAIKGQDDKAIGLMNDNNNKLNTYIAGATRDLQYSETVMSAYDKYIASLQRHQAVLSKQAMNGSQGDETFAGAITGKFVQGLALEGALKTAKTRDR